MMEVKSSVDARGNTERKAGGGGGFLHRTKFIGPQPGNHNYPQAFLIESQGERNSPVHFHTVNQWQIIVAGSGTFGRHEVAPITIHYAKAYTPYGPLNSSAEGLSYFTLRAAYDPGALYLPAARAQLKPTGKPFQVTTRVERQSQDSLHDLKGAILEPIPDIQRADGLAAYMFRAGHGMVSRGPDPNSGSGQYFLVYKGSLILNGREFPEFSCGYVSPDEVPLELQAGSGGLEAIIVQFPRAEAGIFTQARSGAKKWECGLCAFSYIEADGLAVDHISPGTPWEKIPDTWTCPDCGASKADFKMTDD